MADGVTINNLPQYTGTVPSTMLVPVADNSGSTYCKDLYNLYYGRGYSIATPKTTGITITSKFTDGSTVDGWSVRVDRVGPSIFGYNLASTISSVVSMTFTNSTANDVPFSDIQYEWSNGVGYMGIGDFIFDGQIPMTMDLPHPVSVVKILNNGASIDLRAYYYYSNGKQSMCGSSPCVIPAQTSFTINGLLYVNYSSGSAIVYN